MSLNLTTFTRSLRIYPSPYPIPSPFTLGQSSQDIVSDTFPYFLYAGIDFQANGVSPGDIIYVFDDSGNFYSTTQVVGNISYNSIEVADSIPQDYTFIIYQQSAISGLGNQGCNLFFTSGSSSLDILFTTISGDNITLNITKSESFVVPIQASYLINCSDPVYALW